MHGTTVGTNALLERRGARAGLITTAGFRDVLEMRRRDRRQTWGLTGSFTPVIERDMRLEVAERTLADGTIHTPVDLDAVRAAAAQLRAAGAEAICIVFLHSYANPAHERAALDAVRAVWPTLHVAASHQILPEMREFERTSTTALNAVLQPVVGSYLGALDARLRADRFTGEFLIVQSNGGVMSVATAQALPVRTALSGPAAGVIAAAHIAAASGFPDVITGDIGGTSFDVSLIAGGEPQLAAQSTLDFGLVVRTPMIEITTIGAGGGSIARVDAAGLLQVGPQSAGSTPGPACFGVGDRPTLTDANVVLGRINAERPIGGTLTRLDADAAARAIERDVGRPLGLDVTAAAAAILRVANARMASALRLVSVERGHDPQKFSLMPFGGGGALHAGALMREVGLARAIVPRFPGVTSALGCVIADMRHDRVQTLNRLLAELDPARLAHEMDQATAELSVLLDRATVAFTGRQTVHELDMSYVGQTHTVAVRVRPGASLRRTRRGVRGDIWPCLWPCHAGCGDARAQPAHGRDRLATEARPDVDGAGAGRVGRGRAARHAPHLVRRLARDAGHGPAHAARRLRRARPRRARAARHHHPDRAWPARPGGPVRPRDSGAGMNDTALLLCDLQNDFVHPNGAYGRAGLGVPEIAALPGRLRPLADALRAAGGWIVSTHFTLVPGRAGAPFISPHLHQLRPFLAPGDFAPGTWGHAMVDALSADLSVEKVAYSAFYMSRLEWVLNRAGVKRLLVAGIVTNGGVASTARDAAVRDYEVTVLEDGCAAFKPDVHEVAVEALRPVAAVRTVAQALSDAERAS